MRINYVIATWDGKNWNDVDRQLSGREILNEIGKPRADEVLALHLSYLSKLRHQLAQITIVRPTEHKQPRYDDYYKKADEALKSLVFSCPVVHLVSDRYKYYSYGQWLHVYETYRDQFDYYIYVEDDTVAAIPYFDIYLTSLFQQRVPEELGYLATKIGTLSDPYYTSYDPKLKDLSHLMISTGITNSKTLAKLFETYRGGSGIYQSLETMLQTKGIQNHPFTDGNLMQVNFSLLFTNISSIHDYSPSFSCPYWLRESGPNKNHLYKEYGNSETEPLIMPITMVMDGTVERLRLTATLGFLDESVAIRRMKLIGMNKTLKELDLSNQHLHEQWVPNAFSPQLTSLNLSHNSISDASIHEYLRIQLRRLNLSHTHVSDEGVETLAKHPTLEFVSLVGNNVTTVACLMSHPTIQEIEVDEEVTS